VAVGEDIRWVEGEKRLIDEQARAAVVGIIVIIAAVNASSFFLANRVTEPFSELGVLGPTQKISGYPTNLTVGQGFLLYGYVGNHEGTVNYYQVLVKLGNQGTLIGNSTSANAPELSSYGLVLASNQSSIFPMRLALDTAGLNQRVIFELWMLNSTSSQFDYTGLWNQIWVNVTAG
jgi:uncharacterized membrane protein